MKVIIALLSIIALFVVGVVLYLLSSVLIPFVVALMLSFILRPVVLWLVDRNVPKAIAVIIVMILVAGVLTLIPLIIVPSVSSFAENLPTYEVRLTSLVDDLLTWVRETAVSLGLDPGTFQVSSLIKGSTITGVLTATIGSFLASLSNGFIILIILIFLLAGSGDMGRKVHRAFSEEQAEQLSAVIENIDNQVRQYLVTKTLINLIAGATTTIILLILGVDYAIVWGLLSFLFNYIPNVGSFISTIFPVLMAFVQFDSLTMPLLTLGLLIVGENIIGNVVEPKMMQSSLNLSPVLIIVSLIFWGWLWGIWGMILSIPITSTIKIICENVEQLKPIAVLMSGGTGAPDKDRKKGKDGGDRI